MKKEVTLDLMWHLNEVVIPFPVTIVTTLDQQGRVNAAPFGLVLPFSNDKDKPQMLLCSASMWHTAANIEATGEFVINYVPYRVMEQAAQTGLMYSEGINELGKAGLTEIPSLHVRPPRIEECFQHFECRLDRVLRPNDHQSNFVGDIVSVSINEELIGQSRTEKLSAAEPLLLFGVDITTFRGDYAAVGKTRSYAPPLDDVE